MLQSRNHGPAPRFPASAVVSRCAVWVGMRCPLGEAGALGLSLFYLAGCFLDLKSVFMGAGKVL